MKQNVPADSGSSTRGRRFIATLVYGVSPYTCVGDFPSVSRSTPPHRPISERTVPQSKAPLQGVNESLHPSAQMAVQPGGASRFTIALDPVPFWNPFIWWPKIRPPNITAQFCALVHKPLHIRRGVHIFVETQSIPAFFICTQHKNKPLCAFSALQNVV